MQKVLVMAVLVLFLGCDDRVPPSSSEEPVFSNVKPDEHVVFFRTSGWLDTTRHEWHLPIHGWIYEPEDSSSRKAAFETALEKQFGLVADKKTAPILARRLNLLIADNERDKGIVIQIAGRNYELPPSADNGHIKTTIAIPLADVEEYSSNGFIDYVAVTRAPESREFKGMVRLVEPSGRSVISDIDDTVKITDVTERRSMLNHTFLLDFVAAPGMAQLYGDWATDGVSFHFVSSSPWQLYSPLSEFLDDNGFPWATFNLKAIRFRDETIFDLFKKGTETKPAIIEQILVMYPGRQFVLVGDSGEQDPEVYAGLLRKHPEQVLKVYIRNVTAETADNARFTAVFDDIDAARWQLFEDPQSLTLPLGW